MPHTTSFDHAGKILTVSVKGLWTEEDAITLDQELKEYLPLVGDRMLAVDLETAVRFEGTEARRKTAKVLQDYRITHLAVFNARPAVRILVKILLQLTAAATAGRFFSTQQQAVAWLEQERQGK